MPRKKFLPASFNVPALLASVGVAFGIVLVVTGLNVAVTGRDALNLPEQIERLSPANNEKVLRQSEIMIDFVAGFEAVLIIDGLEIPTTRLDELSENGKQPKPGEQVEIPPTAIYDPGNYTLSYLPQEGGPITELKQGDHQATVLFWKAPNTREKATSYSWKFSVD
ncbi:MAG: hypothetical protein WCG65_10550 [Actinomycetes bacterium]